ncbi:MAG: type I-E CRISPR-associated protein Cas7/Cse4/CasC, partial [Bacteriovoracales bacterium]|nr:type I-E CRISPR-associated protein Cas7/Cse4/CasC [Bacteriovoracales bacterium]
MARFVQLHLLTSYPPSNLNRDDLGRPKTAIMGGVSRMRISSQSLKRAWRTSDYFQNALGDFIGQRTKIKGYKIFKTLLESGVPEEKATEWTKKIVEKLGDLENGKKDSTDKKNENSPEKKLKTEQLVHLAP